MENSRSVSSPRADRRERENARRREDVLGAASTAFAERGFQGAQVSEIAAAAELSTKSVYALFPSKEVLYEEVIRSAAEAVREKVQLRVEALDDPGEQLLQTIDSLFACFDEHQDLLVLYARSTHGLPWRVRQNMGESTLDLLQGFTDWIVAIARRAKKRGYLSGLDPDAVAVSVVGTVTSSAARWVESEQDHPISASAPAVRALFERLLGRESSK